LLARSNGGSNEETTLGHENVLAWPRGSLTKRVLYHAPSPLHLGDLLGRAADTPGCSAAREPPTLVGGGLSFRLDEAHDVEETLGRLGIDYYNLFVLDLRTLAKEPDGFDARAHAALALLDALDDVDIEERYGFHRILVVLSQGDERRIDRFVGQLGARGVTHVLRDAGERFPLDLVQEMTALVGERRTGKTALCLAGGAITGLYFELGALKCLDDCLGDTVSRFDAYFGISAGAVVAGILANGYSVDEIMASFAAVDGGRIPPMSLNLLRLGHLDLSDLRARAGRALRQVARGLWSVLRGDRPLALAALFPEYSDWVGPPLCARRFERTLRDLFTAEGATNDFRRLRRPLYVGATEQDTRTHVLFGDAGYRNIPVSRAIQASLSMNPAFSSTRVGDRYYTDGAVTRTSNFTEAIRKGADLVFLIDPFVPYVSQTAGFSRARGVLYNIDQDVRAMSYTRLELARQSVLRRHPEVSSYAIFPSNDLRRVLSVNPMDHRPFLAIWRGAYLSTLRRLRVVQHRLAGDLAFHGIAVDTRRAEEVAARLERTPEPSFADFFPGGRVRIRRPPLCLEERAEGQPARFSAA
jgi:predicted acylesterase/phospholipase RssA